MPGVRADCHQIVHSVGHAALAYYHNNAADALAHGVDDVQLGLLPRRHRALDRRHATSEIVKIVRKLCTSPR